MLIFSSFFVLCCLLFTRHSFILGSLWVNFMVCNHLFWIQETFLRRECYSIRGTWERRGGEMSRLLRCVIQTRLHCQPSGSFCRILWISQHPAANNVVIAVEWFENSGKWPKHTCKFLSLFGIKSLHPERSDRWSLKRTSVIT